MLYYTILYYTTQCYAMLCYAILYGRGWTGRKPVSIAPPLRRAGRAGGGTQKGMYVCM